MDFDKLVKRTEEVSRKLGTKFDKRDRALDLVEEVGELANSMLVESGRKPTSVQSKKRTIDDIADALADIMFDVILLARDYNINLSTEYEKMLDSLEERIIKGEFKPSE